MAARASFFLLLLLVAAIATIYGPAQSMAQTTSTATNFVKTSCRSTQYQTLCVRSLTVYSNRVQQSPRQLARIALAVALSKAQIVKTYLSRLRNVRGLKRREVLAVRDCYEEIDDMVDRLSNSIAEIKQISKSKAQDFVWHISNIQTWASAALTDAGTCVDGFQGLALNSRVRTSITGFVSNASQHTSIALALVNKYGSRRSKSNGGS